VTLTFDFGGHGKAVSSLAWLSFVQFSMHVFLCHSPVKDTVVTNDRWGSGIVCSHGGYLTCYDRYNPGQLRDLFALSVHSS